MTNSDHDRDYSERLSEAICWHVRLKADDASEADFQAFTVWLEQNPENRNTFDSVEQFDASFDAESLADARKETTTRVARRTWLLSRGVWVAGATTLVAAIAAVFIVLQIGEPATATYSTTVGRSETVTLADGTNLTLNTATLLTFEQTSSERRVVLDHGEAVFHPAAESRPFVVTVGSREVRDVGTIFNVLRADRTITVTVAEGRVGVAKSGGGTDKGAVTLAAGDQLVYREATSSSQLNRVDPAQVLAWRQGYLIYRKAPITRVISDLNRYFAVPIQLEGNAAGFQRFSGVLRIDNEKAVIRRLSQFLPVIAVETKDKIVLRAAAATP